jgi:type I restriction enzyme S subunit
MSQASVQNGWIETTIGEVIKVGRGSSPRPIQKFIAKSGIPWVKIADATASNSRFINKTKEFIKEEGRSTTVHVGDLIVSNSATPGIPKFMGIDACVHDGWLVFDDYKGIDKLFLYYFFLDYRKRLEHAASGTVFKNLTTDIVRKVPILLPPLTEQSRIAAILSSLDDKIELIQTQNKTLEEIAQKLFHEWFVEFDFPNDHNDEMVDSLMGKIPKNWQVAWLGDIVEIKGGSTPSTTNPDFWGGDIAWTSPKDLSENREIFLQQTGSKITELGLTQISSGLLPLGTILLSSRAPIGYVAISDIPVAINQGYIAILPREDYPNLFMFLWIKEHMNKIISAANGSTFLEISKSAFRRIEIVRPPETVVASFMKIVNPIFKKIARNEAQLSTLKKLRDSSLPQLMLGNIRVNSF